MRDIKERKADLKRMLDEAVDPLLLDCGFTRRKGSATYKLKLPEGVQEIVFSADYSPNYKPGAEARIFPHFVLKLPRLQEVALNLVNGDESLFSFRPDQIFNQLIEFAAPKDERPRWYTYDADDYLIIGKEICRFIETWLFPFMEGLQNPDDLIAAHEASDDRVIKQNNWYIRVAAAYLLLGNRDAALAVLEGRFKKPDAPKRYAVVFETLPGIATS